jgi:stalled ribosome rescue protein Dom34
MSINFSANANRSAVSAHSLKVLEDILRVARVASCLITSASRSPADQARIMYANIISQGVASQKALYAAPGRAVIDEYLRARAAKESPDKIRAAMERKILQLGPGSVSRHCADFAKLNVVDIAPSSISNRAGFISAVNDAVKRGVVSKFLQPGNNDPAFHLEIPQLQQ